MKNVYISMGILLWSLQGLTEPSVSSTSPSTPSTPSAASLPLTISEVSPKSPEVGAIPLRGQVFEMGTRLPLANVNVFVLPLKLKLVTDAQGFFSSNEIPEGDLTFIINLTGYLKSEVPDRLTKERSEEIRKIYLEKLSYSGFETTIVGGKKKSDGSQKSLSIKEVLSMPGANGDPIKAVQNLPGVSRTQGFSSQVVIQGSAPKDTAYDLDGHRIPLVFHFGGLSSVVFPEVLEQVDYLSAGYGAFYSRALGGVISLKTNSNEKMEREQKGFVFVDTLKAGALIEKKIDETSSIQVGGRISYIGLLLGKIAEKDSQFNLTVAPEFSDFTLIHKKILNEKDSLKTVLVSSKDTLGFLIKEPLDEDPSIRGDFKSTTQFYRIIPQWRHQWNSDSVSNFSLGYGTDQINTLFGSNFFKLKSDVLSVRGDWQFKIQSDWKSQIGFDHIYRNSQVTTRIPKVSSEGGITNPIGSADTIDLNVKAKLNDLGLFWKNEWIQGPWTLRPGLRWDQFRKTKENLLTPRMEVLWAWSESLELRSAWGLYVQSPEPQEISEEFGNPDLKSPHAEHRALGFSKNFKEGSSEGWVWDLGLFQRQFSKLVSPSKSLVLRNGTLTSENFNNQGKGTASGVETALKYDSVFWSSRLSYTYSRSTRIFPPRGETLFEYDQTHNLNWILSMPLGRHWTLASRFRYTTGNPNTPLVGGIFDSDADVYLPLRGGYYSERFSDFSQWDLRVDKKWIADEQIWSVYCDIQNIFNRPNSESFQYSYDYKQRALIAGLPIIPTIGVKGEF